MNPRLSGIGQKVRLLLLAVALGAASCTTISSLQADGRPEASPPAGDVLPTVAVTPRSVGEEQAKEILSTVDLFWKAASVGGDEEAASFIRPTPDGFWKAGGGQTSKNTQGTERPQGTANGEQFATGDLSPELSRLAYLELTSFAKEIREKRLELLKSVLVRANDSEAMVKIDFTSAARKADGIWTSSLVLLFRDSTGWKLFQSSGVQNVRDYNPAFAESKD